MISAILAISENNAIGKDDKLPWPHIPEDMKWFQKITTGHIVVMGSKTWKSLGAIKPLKNRLNYVFSRKNVKEFNGADGTLSGHIGTTLKSLDEISQEKDVFVIGGAEIYKQSFDACDKIYICRVKGEFEGDTFIDVDPILNDFKLVHDVNTNEMCYFQVWERKQ